MLEQCTSFEPMDLRLGLTKELESDRVFRWAICGTGRVCHDFTQALKSMSNVAIACVSARKVEKAQEFAKLHSIPEAYGSFTEMAEKGNFDIMYIGTLHPFHREHAEAALNAGKHVVIEKPLTTTFEDAVHIANLAESKGLFFTEGLWTRYFPAVEELRHRIEIGEIGTVSSVLADFGFDCRDNGDYENSDFFNKDLGGGCINYVTPYPLSFLTMLLGNEPQQATAVGTKHVEKDLDLNNAMVLSYTGSKIGVATSNIMVETPEETIICGDKGRITIHTPSHCPTSYTLDRKLPGRGNIQPKRFEFALPEEPAEVTSAGGFVYPNSIGFRYEAAAIMRCIAAGRHETPQYPTAEILALHKLLEKARKDVGV